MSIIWTQGESNSTITIGATMLAEDIYMSAPVKVSALWFKNPYTFGNVKAYIFRVSDKALIASSSQLAFAQGWLQIPISCTLEASVVYRIAFERVGYNEHVANYYNATTSPIVTTVSGISMTVTSEYNGTFIFCKNVSGVYPDMGVSVGTSYGSHVALSFKVEGSVNTAPTISGSANESLGNKNTPFDILFSVNDVDSANILNVIEKLNGSQINSISNAPRNTNFTISITKAILDSLPLNQQSTILISVTDGTATTYKTITFTRTNSGPSITNSDKNLGQVVRTGIAEKYICHDVEGNTFSIVEKVNDIVLKNITGVDGTEYTIGIPEATWIIMPNGIHKYTITATDSLGASIVRTFTFTKKETVIESTGFTNIVPTDLAATKILLTPNWIGKENVDALFEVCNNAYDAVPTWENATSQTLLNKSYIFTNKVKTGTKWGIDIRFKLTLKSGVTDNIEFYGLGGAFE
ncbi:hypothetical protein psyc5s11_44820 [Clostridium gelidum]|uniref:Uncharacterized protein n=1 Tax=Clostridium gelidum TaxID=704125 RepID=A0ABM7T902_9CLOT|nr:hypothetical protein [Clostridium gelidum]BCZ48415.1 hypothetical protein psyc5s11_44820 [Clostridium gelidum]